MPQVLLRLSCPTDSCSFQHMCLLSFVWLCVTPWTAAHQAPLSMGFPKQEYWNGLPFTTSGDHSNQGTKLSSPVLQAHSFLLSHEGSPKFVELDSCKASISSRTAVTRIPWARSVLDTFLAHSSPRRQVLYGEAEAWEVG